MGAKTGAVILESGKERLADALGRLAAEAAALLEELLESGASLPFDINPTQGDGPLPMYQYSPSVGDFIHEQSAELRRLESFVEVRSIIGESRALDFLSDLWNGRSEFTVDRETLEGLIRELAGEEAGAIGVATGDVCVPLVGFRMDLDELELRGVRVVRADAAEGVPGEATSVTGFVAIARCRGEGEAAVATAGDELRHLLTTLRLFKRGGVGLHPHGWVRRGGGWERFETGGARPRQGGYELSRTEAEGVTALAARLDGRESRDDALDWAMSRFELGAERRTVIEALSDYLLALRGLLEGGGPSRTALPLRVAALCAEPPERNEVRRTVECAISVERKLMSGARFGPSASEDPSPRSSPLVVVDEVEEFLRHILERVATGELGSDLRVVADEIMLADGLSVGSQATSIERGETAEWQLPDLSDTDDIYVDSVETEEEEPDMKETQKIEIRDISRAEKIEVGTGSSFAAEMDALEAKVAPGRQAPSSAVRRGEIAEPSDRETRIIACGVEVAHNMAERTRAELSGDANWLDEESDGSVDWPAFASPRNDRRRTEESGRAHAKERVRYLFPVPDGTDWSVGELDYERKRAKAQ